jgi:acylphosphatase
MISQQEHQQMHAIVRGRVQGVSFRYFTLQTALRLGVTGWVRNNPDGTVEVIAQGDQKTLQKLANFLHNGSPSAEVEDIYIDWQDASNSYDRFRIEYH